MPSVDSIDHLKETARHELHAKVPHEVFILRVEQCQRQAPDDDQESQLTSPVDLLTFTISPLSHLIVTVFVAGSHGRDTVFGPGDGAPTESGPGLGAPTDVGAGPW